MDCTPPTPPSEDDWLVPLSQSTSAQEELSSVKREASEIVKSLRSQVEKLQDDNGKLTQENKALRKSIREWQDWYEQGMDGDLQSEWNEVETLRARRTAQKATQALQHSQAEQELAMQRARLYAEERKKADERKKLAEEREADATRAQARIAREKQHAEQMVERSQSEKARIEKEKEDTEREKMVIQKEKLRLEHARERAEIERAVALKAAEAHKSSLFKIEYQADNGRWTSYPTESMPHIIKSIVSGDETCSIDIGDKKYTIRFKEGVQLNDKTRRSRAFRISADVPSQWCIASERALLNKMSSYAKPSFDSIAVWLSLTECDQIAQTLTSSIFHHVELQNASLSPCDLFRENFKVLAVARIENPNLYKQYAQFRRDMEERHTASDIAKIDIRPPICMDLVRFADRLDPDVRKSVNEVFLCHGTSNDKASVIAVEGFDFRLARPGHYGNGTYFASQPCKCWQYCSKDQATQMMFMARVSLGTPYYADRVDKGLKRPPKFSAGMAYDSVIAAPGPMRGHQQGVQSHQEFVIFEKFQAYPEYLIKFTTK